MSLFLTDEELAELTAYRSRRKQAEWLRTHGWRYELDARGRPRVSRRHAERMLDGQTQDSEPQLRLG